MPTYPMIYLGKLPDLDLDERSFAAERAAAFLAETSFGSVDQPLYRQQIAVTMHDHNDDGRILTDNWSGTQENISYTLPDGQHVVNEIDSAFGVYNTEVVRQLPDGSLDRVSSFVRIIQDVSGNLFMMPPPMESATDAEIEAITTYPIVGIALPSGDNFATNYSAAYSGRHGMAQFVPCFTAGTLILTDRGERMVESLTPGDLVWTRDHGLQALRWIGLRHLSGDELRAAPKLRPIRIAAGALGAGRPGRDLVVSPQHRVLVRSAIARRMFGADELLVPARQLIEHPGIDEIADDNGVTYVHLLFDRHEILKSNGAETESLFPGPQALISLGAQVEELFALFPQLRDDPAHFAPARPFATGAKARQLVRRHKANGRALVG